MAVPRCDDPDHCITCSDEGVPMRAIDVGIDGSLAWCIDESGGRVEVLTGLIDDVQIGDVLLVHAATALARLTSVIGPSAGGDVA
jgi:hypothetical protein